MEYISGVKVRKLRLVPEERGWLMEMLRSDRQESERSRRTYATASSPGVISFSDDDASTRTPREVKMR